MNIYNEAQYYEIAFSFVDMRKQIDLFERFIRKFSRVPVRRALDIGCGPGGQLRELAKRGYTAIGLDVNARMLKYLSQMARNERVKVETFKASMLNFQLKKRVDFAFIMMGTISYVKSNQEMIDHLNSVAGVVRKGGLYLIENFRLNWAHKNFFRPQHWTMRRDGIRVTTAYEIKLKDALQQIIQETMKMEIQDHGKRKVVQEVVDTKLIFPQEFLALIEANQKFEFLGWFQRYSLKPLQLTSPDNIVLLRRK